jgi:hypothetical protein
MEGTPLIFVLKFWIVGDVDFDDAPRTWQGWGRDATGVVVGSVGEDVGSDEESVLKRCTT